MNFSCLPDRDAGGVLIRALDPIEGLEAMAHLRGLPETISTKLLTGGPGRLPQALGIKRATHHNVDVTRPNSIHQIVGDGYYPETIDITPRIGIRKATDLPLRILVGRSATRRDVQ